MLYDKAIRQYLASEEGERFVTQCTYFLEEAYLVLPTKTHPLPTVHTATLDNHRHALHFNVNHTITYQVFPLNQRMRLLTLGYNASYRKFAPVEFNYFPFIEEGRRQARSNYTRFQPLKTLEPLVAKLATFLETPLPIRKGSEAYFQNMKRWEGYRMSPLYELNRWLYEYYHLLSAYNVKHLRTIAEESTLDDDLRDFVTNLLMIPRDDNLNSSIFTLLETHFEKWKGSRFQQKLMKIKTDHTN